MITLDFESEAIDGNTTKFPPRPVGVALKRAGLPGKYLAWGHPSKNNCSFEEGAAAVREAFSGAWGDVLCHNAKFDYGIAKRYFGVDVEPESLHDTQYLMFLDDPHAANLSLKPSAERILGIPATEQDELHSWILSHIPAATPKTAGTYICEAPGDLVGRYAVGDVERTEGIFQHLWPKVKELMLPGYRREQNLLPVMMKAEENGVRVDFARLDTDLVKYSNALNEVEDKLRKLLKNDNLDFNKDIEIADAVEAAGMAGVWVLTPTGRRSMAKGNLEKGIANEVVRQLLRYRGALHTCLSVFMHPWHRMASVCNGRMHPNWNQVRQARGDTNTAGTRTGRVSCDSPNFTNVPNEFDFQIPENLPPLPQMKEYLLPEEGHVWLKRDYSQQELRILAHYAEGDMLAAYQRNPTVDFHDLARGLIKEKSGIDLPRKYVKITAFSIIYGAGAQSMADSMGVSYGEASDVREAYLETFPGIRRLQSELKYRGSAGMPLRTWGGRHYYCEAPKIINGKYRRFEYKLLNYLIQGSAADCTKDALIEHNKVKETAVFLTSVYDEVNVSAPKEDVAREMKLLEEAMLSPKFDVPMLSDGYTGPNWGTLGDYV